MYSKEEAAKIRHEFWTTFGKYMSPVLSAEGLKTNWINYKTGISTINIRAEAGRKEAFVRLEVIHKDEDLSELYYEQLMEIKLYFEQIVGSDWAWQVSVDDPEDRSYAYVQKTLTKVSVYNKDKWPVIIEFLKTNLILLDEFWSYARYTFLALE